MRTYEGAKNLRCVRSICHPALLTFLLLYPRMKTTNTYLSIELEY